MEPFDGTNEYETHLTVCLNDATSLSLLQRWAKERGLKCVHIVLDQGTHLSQPMLTRHGHGSLPEETATAFALSNELADAGFSVDRIKIEAPPWSRESPRSCEEALISPPSRYFEHHVKFLLGAEADLTELSETAQRHDARLSRNALKQRDDGFQERFLTQRCVSVSRTEAHRRLDSLLDTIIPLGHPILDVEEEYVVYDSNLDLDAGWFRPLEPDV